MKIDTEKAADWIRKGAQPTETVARLIKVAEAQPAPVADADATA